MYNKQKGVKMKRILISLIVMLFAIQLNAQRLEITAPNLVRNPTIKDMNGDSVLTYDGRIDDFLWGFGSTDTTIAFWDSSQTTTTGFWDQSVSHTNDGSGSWRMTPGIGAKYPFGGRVVVDFIEVQQGVEYTFSVYAKASQWPAPSVIFKFNAYDADMGSYWKIPYPQRWKMKGTWGTFTAKDKWEEFSGSVSIEDPNIAYIAVYVLFTYSNPLDGVKDWSNLGFVWVDDFYAGKQTIGFREPPSEKTAFNGTQTKVDELGNIQIKNGDQWEPYFPLTVFGADDRYVNEYQSIYAAQGFNTLAVSTVSRAQMAVSAGMRYAFDFTQFIPVLDSANQVIDVSEIASIIQELKGANILDKCVYWYLDNKTTNNYKMVKAVTEAIHENDNSAHPIYMNTWINTLEVRRYANQVDSSNLIDMVGACVGNGEGALYDGTKRLKILNNQMDVTVPGNMASIYDGVGDGFRATVYAAIAQGTKGFSFSKDKAPDNPIENYSWWSQLPTLKTEIDTLLADGFIQAPHYTDWKIVFDNNEKTILESGTRQLGDNGYIILANLDSNDVTTNITIDGLGYSIVQVTDYFTKEVVVDSASIANNSFEVTIPAYGAVIYKLEDQVTGVEKENQIVHSFSLEQNYPNPFNPTTNIRFSIPKAAKTSLSIYNILGQKVATLFNKKLSAGTHTYKFDASNLTSGIYFYKLQSGNLVETKKLMLMK